MEITPEILRKIQLLEMKILIELKRICEKHDIAFILIGGTLLGAIRHKGFIPWDDDIDIGMTRENFEKFCKVAPTELSKEYFLQTPFSDKKCFNYCCARIRLNGTKLITETAPKDWEHNGFFVDILPYDKIPNSYLRGYCYWTLFNILIRVCWLRKGYHPRPKGILSRVIMYLGFFICLPVTTKKLISMLENYHKKYENYNGKYVDLLIGSWGFKRERHLYSTISKIIYVPFENELMPIPEKYDLFLHEQYGDYMTLPPVNLRKARHAIELDFGIY